MSGKAEVQGFLQALNVNLNIWGVFFRNDRGKNMATLLELDITPNYRLEVIKSLQPEHYSQGPLKEQLNGGADMWVFGKDVKEREVYIKMTMGYFNGAVLCISFHIAEYKMTYPFKN